MYKALDLYAATRLRITTISRLCQKRMVSSVPTASEESAGKIEKKDPDALEKVDVGKLPPAQQRFVREIHRLNDERIQEVFRRNYRNIAGLVIISAVVLSIYFYTMYAVKQETILEEIDDEISQESTTGEINAGK